MRLTLYILAVAASAAALTVHCRDAPTVFTLPGNITFPEGIASQPGTPYFYTASTRTGTVYRGSLDSPTLTPFIEGAASNMTMGLGMKLFGDHLLIAGGSSGVVFDFSISSRKLLHRFRVRNATGVLLNDLDVDASTGSVYVTDSFRPMLWKICGDQLRSKEVDQVLDPWIDLTGKVVYQAGVNGNGISVLPGQRHRAPGFLVFTDFNDNALYRVGLMDKSVQKITLDKAIGQPDGILYDSPYLYSVNSGTGANGYVDVVELKPPYTQGSVKGRIENELLNKPSTAAFARSKKELLVVNFQGSVTNPALPFSVVKIPAKW